LKSHIHTYKLLTLLIAIGLLTSCSAERFVPEGKFLYDGAEVVIVNDTIVQDDATVQTQLEAILRPEPNTKFLGNRPGLTYYYKAQREKPGFLNKWLNKKFGEEPVYLDNVQPLEVEDIIKNRLENMGFFYTEANYETYRDSANKSATLSYSVKLKQPYKLQSYQLDSDSLLIYQPIKSTLEDSPLKKGNRFDLGLMKLERERIDRELKQRGYYNFNSGFLIFEADTNRYDAKKFDLFVRLKKDVPKKSIIPYKIRNVNIYPNYVQGNYTTSQDSVRYADKNFIQSENFFKPKRLDPYILLEEGDLYDPVASRNTSRRLAGIGAYKFVNIDYKEIDTLATDSLGILDANIYLSPLNKRALRAELQAVTKSNNFAGPNLALTFTNRNLFQGGETLNITGKVGYETQFASGENAGLSSITLGLGADLIFPRLLFPVTISKNYFKYDIPKTKISLEGDYLNRSQLYSITSGSATFGYLWNANKYVTHELNPISIQYTKLGSTTDEFNQILEDNPFLQNSFEQQFIAGLTYSFYYSEMASRRTHQFYLNTNLDVAGNTVSLFGQEGDNGKDEFLGLEYAQYAKLDIDVRYHFNFGKEQKIATRFFAGYGLPYGNSEVLPFTKQYFSGGPYSVRAFRTRSLGPGTFPLNSEDDREDTFFDQSGNVRLEANIEYRYPIFGVVKGAVFADAGNVWNTDNDETSLPGGEFSSNFINELGIGVGTGVRVDIQGFVIRLDYAVPIHTPFKPEGERYGFEIDNSVLNFAIGYPF
jgi:outer membrane protein insertion porin family